MFGAFLLTLVAALAGCATDLPTPIARAPEVEVDPSAVAAEPERYRERRVRWGGTIAGVENRADATEVEVVSRPLARSGRPREVDRTEGRFLAVVPGFLDPTVYAEGRELTVAGPVVGVRGRPIGEYPYRFPVVQAEAHHLWAPLPEPLPAPYYYSPFWYPHPFYGPPGCWRWPGYCW